MKRDVPALPTLTQAEDPCALLGNPWADADPPRTARRRGLAAVWPFHLPQATRVGSRPLVTVLSQPFEPK